MLLVVIAVLSIILFPCPVYHWLRDPKLITIAAAAATLIPALVSGIWSRRAIHLLDATPHDPHPGQSAFGWSTVITQVLLVGLHATLLLVTDWVRICDRLPFIGGWVVVPTLAALTPFVISLLLVWIVTYPAERAIRQISLEIKMFRGKPVRPVWELADYLQYNLRHQLLFVLIPILLIVAARDAVEMYLPSTRNQRYGYLPDLLLGGASMLVAVFAPVLLRYIWTTRPLPSGPLRDKLELLSRKLRLKIREILVWQTGGVITNAAVMGVIGPLRYVLITDAMLEQMDDTKIEAVFGHEAGHAKRHHILYFLLFALISGCLVTIFSIHYENRAQQQFMQWVVAPIYGVVMTLKWFVIFLWVSRRFEWQADAYGVQTLALAGLPCTGPCALHSPSPDAPPARPGDPPPLCATAAQVFGDTLNAVAVLNGFPADAPSWRHGSISWRSRFVNKLANDPVAWRNFERTVARIKLTILVLAIASAAWASWEMKLWRIVGLNW